MNSADQLIFNASVLADAGDADGAMAALEDAIALSEVAHFPLQLLRARLLLGELLLDAGHEEDAMAQFRDVLLVAPEVDASLVDEEVAAATAHLSRRTG